MAGKKKSIIIIAIAVAKDATSIFGIGPGIIYILRSIYA
jgi:hypothetical protein